MFKTIWLHFILMVHFDTTITNYELLRDCG